MTHQITQLESLVELYRQGKISETEYNERKQTILQEVGGSISHGRWPKSGIVLLVALSLLALIGIGWHLLRGGGASLQSADSADVDHEPELLGLIREGDLQACATDEAKMRVLHIVGGSEIVDEYLRNGGNFVQLTAIRAAGADRTISQVSCEAAIEGRARTGQQVFSIPVRYDLRPSLESEGQVIATARFEPNHQNFLQMILGAYNRKMEKAGDATTDPEPPSPTAPIAADELHTYNQQSPAKHTPEASEQLDEAGLATAAAAAASNAAAAAE